MRLRALRCLGVKEFHTREVARITLSGGSGRPGRGNMPSSRCVGVLPEAHCSVNSSGATLHQFDLSCALALCQEHSEQNISSADDAWTAVLGAARPGHCDPTCRGEQQDAGGLGAVLDRELAMLTSAQLRLLPGV